MKNLVGLLVAQKGKVLPFLISHFAFIEAFFAACYAQFVVAGWAMFGASIGLSCLTSILDKPSLLVQATCQVVPLVVVNSPNPEFLAVAALLYCIGAIRWIIKFRDFPELFGTALFLVFFIELASYPCSIEELAK